MPCKTSKHKTLLWLVARVASDHSKICNFPLALSKNLKYIETLQNLVCFEVVAPYSLVICHLYNILPKNVLSHVIICDKQQSLINLGSQRL